MDNDSKIGADGLWSEDDFLTTLEETDEYYCGHEGILFIGKNRS